MTAQKILIVGSPGAGKTYFSREIAEITGLPLIHLDKYFHVKKHNYYDDREAWVKRVQEFVEEPRWIIEGNYGATMYERMKAADQVIFLDYPTYIAVGRMLKRRVQYSKKPRDEMPTEWKEKIEPSFARFVAQFRKTQRPRIVKYIQDSGVKAIFLKNPREAKQYLSELEKS